MKKRISIPLALLLVSAFLLSGCTQGVKDSFNKGKEDANQQLEQSQQSTPSATASIQQPTPTQVPITEKPKTEREKIIEIIKANARTKWGDDYKMVKYEQDNQIEAYNWITKQTEYPDIMEKAENKWGYDFKMVKYEYENQVEAYKSL
jgi:predicted nucleotidyltransferase